MQLNIHQIRTHFKERSAEDFLKGIFKYAYAILFCDFLYTKTYVMGTRFNCLDLLRQFKQVPTTYVVFFNEEVDKSTMAVI